MVRTCVQTSKSIMFREPPRSGFLTKDEILMLSLDGKYLWLTEYEGRRMKVSEIYIMMSAKEQLDLIFSVEIMWWFDNRTHNEDISWLIDLFPCPGNYDDQEQDVSGKIRMVVNRIFNYHSYSVSSEILKTYDPLTIYYYSKYSDSMYSPYITVSHVNDHLTPHKNTEIALSVNRKNLHEMKVRLKVTYDDIDLEEMVKILAFGGDSEKPKDNFQLALEYGVSYPVKLNDLEDKIKNPRDKEYWAFHLHEKLLSWGMSKRKFFHLEYILIAIRSSCDKKLIPAVGYETEDVHPLIRHGIFDWEELSLMRNTLLEIPLADHIMSDVRDNINGILMLLPISFPVSINMKEVEMNWQVYQRVKNALDIIYDMKKYRHISKVDINRHINLLDRKLLTMSKDDVDTWGNLLFISCYPNHRLADVIYAIRMFGRDDAVEVIYEYIKSLDVYTVSHMGT
jgi:hypothetical protein